MGGQRRKKGGRVTPKCSAPIGRLTLHERAGLEEIFERIFRTAPKELTDDLPPVAVEMWASQMWSIWAKSELVGMDATEVFAGGMITYAGIRATPGAQNVLRALASVAPAPYGQKARRAADRLAAHGVREPTWAEVVGTWEPTVAWLSFDPVDDDGVVSHRRLRGTRLTEHRRSLYRSQSGRNGQRRLRVRRPASTRSSPSCRRVMPTLTSRFTARSRSKKPPLAGGRLWR